MPTEDNETPDEVEVAPPEVDESGTTTAGSSDVPPEQQTPAAGGPDLAVPSAAGPAEPPHGEGNAGGTTAPVASDADEASPTGGANTAGTPQGQLDQAPPMADPSGSNIPAPNLVQPPAEGVLPTGTASAGNLDPAVVSPDEAAVARVEGRTSDASTRAEGTHIDEVGTDVNDGPKPSDGGPELYPFPQGGDVEVATIPDDSGANEFWAPLNVEDTVILGEHESIPERLQGRRAFVIDAPRYLIPVGREGDVWIRVRTRDEVNANLSVPLSAVTVQRGGVDHTVRG